MTELDDIEALMLSAALKASREILAVYATPFDVERKSDGSPVTEADGRAEAVILDTLRPTALPVLAEESVSAGHVPALGRRFFVVDPLDGTREFLKRNGEFTVNIALVEDGSPLMGVILVPVTGDVYFGGRSGAWRGRAEGDTILGRHPLSARDAGPIEVVASRSHGHRALAQLVEEMELGDNLSVGSSLKFCLLAEGKARLYPRLSPTCEWDTAAGQAILEAAGGVVVTMDGEPLRYGRHDPGQLNPWFVAASDLPLALEAVKRMKALLPA